MAGYTQGGSEPYAQPGERRHKCRAALEQALSRFIFGNQRGLPGKAGTVTRRAVSPLPFIIYRHRPIAACGQQAVIRPDNNGTVLSVSRPSSNHECALMKRERYRYFPASSRR
jgi:hypothetical protein